MDMQIREIEPPDEPFRGPERGRVLRRDCLILAALLTLWGIVQCLRWVGYPEAAVRYAVNFLPPVFFALVYLKVRKTSNRLVHAMAASVVVIGVLATAFVNLALEVTLRWRVEITDVRRYERILAEHWRSDELVTHFPRPIPADTRNVRFAFFPGFMQAGQHVQLRYATSPETIRALYEKFSGRKTKSYVGGNCNNHMNMKEGMPTTFFYTSGTGDRRFPADYEIMIFDEVLKEEHRKPGFYWNHGRSHGVAISLERNEIVYWAEAW